MNYTSLVMKTTIRNNFRWQTIAMLVFGILLLCVVGVTIIFIILLIDPELQKAVPDKAALSNALGLIMFITSFVSVGVYCSVFAGQSLVREKSRGNIQALLATPVKPMQVCLGKTLGTFIPGFVLSVVLTLLVYVLINAVYFLPVTGFIGNGWLFINNLLMIPMFFLFLVLLVNLIGMAGKANTGNIVGQVPLSVLPALLINISIHTSIRSDSWIFTLILLGLVAVAGVTAWLVNRKFSTENVILSK